jgi:6-phosphogluconolactonase/glucosamine-6-phosphate isomerase/deaminase
MIEFKTTTDSEVVVRFLAQKMLSHLANGEHVVWFIPGGSSIPIAVEAAKIIREHPHQNLTVTLTDERYGSLDHIDSNWNQLIKKGFSLPQAEIYPVLTGDDRNTTTEKFNAFLEKVLVQRTYKIGLFGIGADGHTAGILPGTSAVGADTFAHGYETREFERITLTPKAIALLDEVVVYAMGEAKWPTLAKLHEDSTMSEQPAQSLKRAPLVTIFTDYQLT